MPLHLQLFKAIYLILQPGETSKRKGLPSSMEVTRLGQKCSARRLSRLVKHLRRPASKRSSTRGRSREKNWLFRKDWSVLGKESVLSVEEKGKHRTHSGRARRS